jgi:hypothetical protein
VFFNYPRIKDSTPFHHTPMPPSSVAPDRPPVLDLAAADSGLETVASLATTIAEASPEDRTSLLSVDHWNCPFGCGTQVDSISGIRRHITRSQTQGHANEHGRTPSTPIPGYSLDGTPVAVITAATTQEHSQIVPAEREQMSPRPASPLWLTREAFLEAHPSTLPLSAVSKRQFSPEGTSTRWICSLCGNYTATTPSEIHGHAFAKEDPAHSSPTDADHIGLLLSVDQTVHAFLTAWNNTPSVASGSLLDQLPDVTLPKHWELRDDYEIVDEDVLDVEYWKCPHCGDHISDTIRDLHLHIVNAQSDNVHDGASGYYPDTLIEGYHDGELVGFISPASKADPNDTPVVLSSNVPTIDEPLLEVIVDADHAKENTQAALASLGVEYPVNDFDLTRVLELPFDVIAEARNRLDDYPLLARDETATLDRIKRLELALATSIASQLRNPFALRAFCSTENTEATPDDIPDGDPENLSFNTDTLSPPDIETASGTGTKYYRIQAPSDAPSSPSFPPEPILVTANTAHQEELATNLDIPAVSEEQVNRLYERLDELDTLLTNKADSVDTAEDTQETIDAAKDALERTLDATSKNPPEEP